MSERRSLLLHADTPLAEALRDTGFPASDVRSGRSPDMGERWIVTELEPQNSYKLVTDPGFVADLDKDGREIARRPADRIRQREHETLDAAIDDYFDVLRGGKLPKIEHRPDGRSGASTHDKLSPLEIAKLAVKAANAL